ncbi:DNA gyrase subunit B [Candidatus Sumerlaeota bacterium]|nr:DNA gyrase subunit B [Candidatus Sumerlaeota bacterium]
MPGEESANVAVTKKPAVYDENSIKALEGREAVRKRPGMYIGNTESYGLHHMIAEVVDNSIDEALTGNCDEISLVIHYDNSVTITDNGRGIPVKESNDPKYKGKSTVEVVMTVLHAGGKFDNEAYQYSGGLHGVGVSCVNFLSEWMEVEVKRLGNIYEMRFERGVPVTPLHETGKARKTGTKIRFRPDPDIFDNINFSYDKLEGRFRDLAFLNPGVTMTIEDERSGKKNEFQFKNGIVEFFNEMNLKRQVICKPIYFEREREFERKDAPPATMVAQIALQYVADSYSENLFCFTNMIPNPDGGTHASGFRGALTRTLNAYARKNDLLKKLKEGITGDDVREGLCAVVSIKMPNPVFESQTKVKLTSPEVEGLVQKVVNDGLMEYLEENPSIAKKIIMKVVTAAEARIAAHRARLTVRKSALEITSLPGKLSDCSDKDPENTELFIVEGDSAGGPARQGRDRHFQAILPIKGKILNTERARLDKVLGNDEIRSMVTALGTGIGENYFDLGKLRYGKIIIMTDADVDGAHIRTLLLTFFYRKLPELITNKKVYIALPPLYRITKGKKSQYIETDEEKDKYLMELGSSAVNFRVNNGADKELNRQQIKTLVETLYALEEIDRTIQRKGVTLQEFVQARDEATAEFPAYLIIHDHDKLFMHTEEEVEAYEEKLMAEERKRQEEENGGNGKNGQSDMLDDDVEQDFAIRKKVQKLFEVHEMVEGAELDKLIQKIERQDIPFAEYFEKNAFDNTRDDEEAPFFVIDKDTEHPAHSLVEAFEIIKNIGAKGLTIQRYKGLGEMNHDQLWETTMDPSTRTLKLVTLETAASADETFSTLMGDQVLLRRAFIQQYAPEVRNLDI